MYKSKPKIIAVKVTGSLHNKKNIMCQDYFAYKKSNSRLVAVVSDGAGSAVFGKIGSQTICKTICDIMSNPKIEINKKNIVFAIDVAREKLLNHRYNKTKSAESLINFAATVIGCVYEKGKGFFFHIGDGAGFALKNNLSDSVVISKPENGLFSCETFFYTMDDWEDSLRFKSFNDCHQICLMTDGVTGFSLKNNFSNIETKFISPILDFLNQENNSKKAKNALFNTLSSPQANKVCSDDKTFVWIRL